MIALYDGVSLRRWHLINERTWHPLLKHRLYWIVFSLLSTTPSLHWSEVLVKSLLHTVCFFCELSPFSYLTSYLTDSVPSKRVIAIIAGTISGFLVLLALAAIVYCLYGKPLKKKIPTSAVPSSMIENENKDGSVDPRNVSEVAGRDKF